MTRASCQFLLTPRDRVNGLVSSPADLEERESAGGADVQGHQLAPHRDAQDQIAAGPGEAGEAGFTIAAIGETGVDRLLGSIHPDLKLLHLCGADRREPDGATQAITRVTVYRATPIAAPDLFEAKESVALIYSPRAGQRFAELITHRGAIAIAAISEAAATASGEGWRTVETAERPTDDALLALAASLCEKPDPK